MLTTFQCFYVYYKKLRELIQYNNILNLIKTVIFLDFVKNFNIITENQKN